MKILHSIVLGTAALLLSMSCAKERPISTGEQEVSGSEQEAVITIGVRTRGVGDKYGTPDDSYINTLRVLGYRTSDGTLAFNEKVYGFPTTSTADATQLDDRKVNVKTGKFTIVFIANEHSEKDTDNDGTSDLSVLLNGIIAGNTSTNTLSYLRGLSFSHEAFDKDKDIPMIAEKKSIIIHEDNKVIEDGSTYDDDDRWMVELTRVGIRLGVKLKLSDAQLAAWPADRRLYFNNVPDRAYIFPGINNSGSLLANEAKFATLTAAAKEGDLNVYVCDRIILPEFCDPNLQANRGLVLSVYQDSSPKSEAVRNIDSSNVPYDWAGTYGYTIPRNHYIDVTAKFNDIQIEFIINVLPWDEPNMGNKELQ